jgi:hypothetical protein
MANGRFLISRYMINLARRFDWSPAGNTNDHFITLWGTPTIGSVTTAVLAFRLQPPVNPRELGTIAGNLCTVILPTSQFATYHDTLRTERPLYVSWEDMPSGLSEDPTTRTRTFNLATDEQEKPGELFELAP